MIQGSFTCRLFLALSNIINRSDSHDEALLLQLLDCVLCFALVDLVVGEVDYAQRRHSGTTVQQSGQSFVSQLVKGQVQVCDSRNQLQDAPQTLVAQLILHQLEPLDPLHPPKVPQNLYDLVVT